jgi:hypothetical protein
MALSISHWRTPEHIEAIGKALKCFGYDDTPQCPAVARERIGSCGSGPWRRVNDIAIANLDKWIPQLNLYNCKRERDGSYKAVATWRPSNTGRPIEQRKRNLSISGRGIKDFGDDRGYSPIDLVMAARSCEFWDAHDWLEQLVDPSDILIDLRPKIPTLTNAKPAASIIANRSTKIAVGSWGIKKEKW